MLRVEGKQNSLFPGGPVIKCFVIPPNSKIEKHYIGVKFIWHRKLPAHDLITCESKVQVCCFPR